MDADRAAVRVGGRGRGDRRHQRDACARLADEVGRRSCAPPSAGATTARRLGGVGGGAREFEPPGRVRRARRRDRAAGATTPTPPPTPSAWAVGCAPQGALPRPGGGRDDDRGGGLNRPAGAMSLHALAVKDAARGGAGSDSEFRFGEGAGGFAERIAAGLGARVRLQSAGRSRAADAAESRSTRPAARRSPAARPLWRYRCTCARASRPACRRPTAAYGVAVKSLIDPGRRPAAARRPRRSPIRRSATRTGATADAGELRRLDAGGLAAAAAPGDRRSRGRRGRCGRCFGARLAAGGARDLPAQLPDLCARRADRLGRRAGRAGRPGALRGRRDVRPAELHGGRGPGGRAGGRRGARGRIAAFTERPARADTDWDTSVWIEGGWPVEGVSVIPRRAPAGGPRPRDARSWSTPPRARSHPSAHGSRRLGRPGTAVLVLSPPSRRSPSAP